MKLNQEEQRNGTIWFFASGIVGLLLILTLAAIDLKLTYSDSEQIHAGKLRQVRVAQSSIATGSVDSRIK